MISVLMMCSFLISMSLVLTSAKTVNSVYCVDLIIIDKMLSIRFLDSDRIEEIRYALKEDGCYKTTPRSLELSLEATFKMHALASMKEDNPQIMEDKNTIDKVFKNSSGYYQPFSNSGVPSIPSMYWGLCLLYS